VHCERLERQRREEQEEEEGVWTPAHVSGDWGHFGDGSDEDDRSDEFGGSGAREWSEGVGA
jgi:hypothetical protein